MDDILTSTTTLGQSRLGNDDIEGVLFRTGASPSSTV